MGLALLFAAGGVAALVSVCEGRWKRHVKGAEGEMRVARALERLPEGYVIRHGLAMEAMRDVDHVVLGPTGLVVVETKNWQGPVTVEEDGWCVGGVLGVRSPIEQAKASAEALARRLKEELGVDVAVGHLVCLAGAGLAESDEGVCTPETLCDVLIEK